MSSFIHDFVLTFVPLFIVIDAFGNIPFLVSVGEGLEPQRQRSIVHVAVLTATAVGLVFLFFGQFILTVLNIPVGSFAIAGGLILLILSIQHMMTGQMVTASREEMVAVVPIGTPLTVGPATITTLLLLALQYRLYIVLIAFAVNMVITWAVFMLGQRISRFLGRGGLRAVSRVFSLLLAALGVNMMLQGLNLVGIIHLGG